VADEFPMGTVLCDTWKLVREIGVGGIGRVYEATDIKLSRKVAVKTLLTDDPETVKRFEREAQVMARVSHPNVITLYGFRRHEGVPFLVMRFLEGRSLSELRAEQESGKVPLATLRPVVQQLLSALGHMHQRGLVHRDIKPSNIFISPQGKVTLLDLGLARGNATTLTKTGVVWGTPSYMAPEQILAERTLDGRADLYGVATVLYRMLTGEFPFPNEELQVLLRAHVENDRPDASEIAPEVPKALSRVLQKAMAIHPDDRYATAAEFLAAFERAAKP
jgi:eukaryotic-like serine/threonine-protein kinase